MIEVKTISVDVNGEKHSVWSAHPFSASGLAFAVRQVSELSKNILGGRGDFYIEMNKEDEYVGNIAGSTLFALIEANERGMLAYLYSECEKFTK